MNSPSVIRWESNAPTKYGTQNSTLGRKMSKSLTLMMTQHVRETGRPGSLVSRGHGPAPARSRLRGVMPGFRYSCLAGYRGFGLRGVMPGFRFARLLDLTRMAVPEL
jgi:hypothetical protein